MMSSVKQALLVLLFFSTALAEKQQIYSFHPQADRLIQIMFPTDVLPSTFTLAYAQRGKIPAFEDLSQVLQYTRDINFADKSNPYRISMGSSSIESYYLSANSKKNGRSQELLGEKLYSELDSIFKGMAKSSLNFSSPLEKALFQRDLFHIFSAIYRATKEESSAKLKQNGERLLNQLAVIWPNTLLSSDEYKKLKKFKPTEINTEYFTTTNRWVESDSYLPKQVLANQTGWYHFRFAEDDTIHFRTFGGRSFIKLYMKVPGKNQQEFEYYWQLLYRHFGHKLTTRSGAIQLPDRSESMLVRTFGVFLKDGSYLDSEFPEEVLMRLFKYGEQNLDLDTSDHRGTLIYQYKLQRALLLKDPSSLGLKRISSDSPSFFGFFLSVPDPANAYSEGVTTMRYNCIACHSELLYGVHTVFSLARKPVLDQKPKLSGSDFMARNEDGRFVLKTPEYLSLVQRGLKQQG